MRSSPPWLHMYARRESQVMRFSGHVSSQNKAEDEECLPALLKWRVCARNARRQERTGEATTGAFEVTCEGRAQSDAWAIITVRQTEDAILERFGIALEAGVRETAIAAPLDPLASEAKALCYNASYPDLIAALADCPEAGRAHFHDYGEPEGRSILFRPYDYAASYPDLFDLVAKPAESARHYIKVGHQEGRPTYFDAYLYGAGYPDVAERFGDDVEQIAIHYVQHGFAEGRHCDNFDWQKYIENNPGAPRTRSAAAQHFLSQIRRSVAAVAA